MKQLSILPLFLIFLLGCATPAEQKNPVTINIPEGQKTEKDFKLSQVFDGVEYVKLETTNACLLPAQVTYSVGKKYIVAAGYTQIYLFDRKGKFIRTIGAKGQGPGEYLHLGDVVTDPEETYILANDLISEQLLKYDFQGNMIGDLKYREKLDGTVQAVTIKSSNEIDLLMVYPQVEKRGFCLIRKLNSNLIQTSSLYPVNSKLVQSDKNKFTPDDFYLFNESIRFRHYQNDTLYGELAGKLVPQYVFPFKKGTGADPVSGSGNKNFVGIIHSTEIPGYLVLEAFIAPKKFRTLIFNQSTHELFTLKQQQPCGSDTKPMQLMINDINGVVHFISLSSKNGLFVSSHQITDLKEETQVLCPKNLTIKLPEKRKELIDLVNKSDEGDNPILQIFYVKQ